MCNSIMKAINSKNWELRMFQLFPVQLLIKKWNIRTLEPNNLRYNCNKLFIHYFKTVNWDEKNTQNTMYSINYKLFLSSFKSANTKREMRMLRNLWNQSATLWVDERVFLSLKGCPSNKLRKKFTKFTRC